MPAGQWRRDGFPEPCPQAYGVWAIRNPAVRASGTRIGPIRQLPSAAAANVPRSRMLVLKAPAGAQIGTGFWMPAPGATITASGAT